MKKCTVLVVILAFAAAASGGWALVERDQRHRQDGAILFERKRLAFAEIDNERLRSLVAGYENAKRSQSQVFWRGTIERTTAQLRGLPFKEPVAYDILSRKKVKEVLLQKLSEQYSDAEIEQTRLGYVALGLIPADYPLKERYVDLLGEQVAAFYDQHAHRLFMFDDATLDSPQNRVILSHELTHALQDQHFGLAKLPLEIKNNDDRAIAASSLVEGDATLIMNAYMAKNLSWKAVGESIGGVFTQNLEQLQAAPRILRESLLFPYTSGLRFCMALEMQGEQGVAALSAAYRKPPASSAQILHPEKYFANEEPVAVVWPDLTVLGQSPVTDNVLGELGTRILLTDWLDLATATAAAEGWRGDRYLVFDGGKALVWRTVWEGPKEADQFADAAERMLQKRYQAKVPKAISGGLAARPVSLQAEGRTLRLIAPHPNERVLIDAPDENWASALAEKFAK